MPLSVHCRCRSFCHLLSFEAVSSTKLKAQTKAVIAKASGYQNRRSFV